MSERTNLRMDQQANDCRAKTDGADKFHKITPFICNKSFLSPLTYPGFQELTLSSYPS